MTPSRKIDYLCIGHLTEDVTPDGIHLGGTATFSTLTAKAFGIHCGLVTSFKDKKLPAKFSGVDTVLQKTKQMVRFENHYEQGKRIQFVTQQTQQLVLDNLPEQYYQANITHIGPILNDSRLSDIGLFKRSFIGITPQGWLREFANKEVIRTTWEILKPWLPIADAVIISQEDIDYNQQAVEQMSKLCKLLIVTEGYHGANLYCQGEKHRFVAPAKDELDPTGAGDIFSTAFFILFQRGYSPILAGKIATEIASVSVTRYGLDSIPKAEEITQILYQNSIRGMI